MKVYFDHAATTPLDKRVKKAMEPYFSHQYGNPGGLYALGNQARLAVVKARENIARVLNCFSGEVVFTGSGTESDNLAIIGVARAYQNPPHSPFIKGGGKRNLGHIITTKIEHHAVLEPCAYLEKYGFDVTYLPVDKNGLVDPKDVAKALRKDTILVSVMYANNEIGTIQPIKEISKVIKNFRKKNPLQSPFVKGGGKGDFNLPIFHTDACQAAAYCDLDVNKLGVDLMTFNGGKIYGPKGVGVLYCRRGVKIEPMIYGGEQEAGLRSGTENVPAIVGMAQALTLARKEKDKEIKKLSELRDYLIDGILKSIPKSFLNGDKEKRLPNNVNISILDIEGEAMVLYLDAKGVMCSTGSACTSLTLEPSHVLLAIGRNPGTAHGSLRLTMGRENTKKEVDYFLKILPGIVKKLRGISPVKM
ncbi:MAG: cysteine desulfurase family protein [bacterium]|nr:cysteine desulfurase family protein [bacterium]